MAYVDYGQDLADLEDGPPEQAFDEFAPSSEPDIARLLTDAHESERERLEAELTRIDECLTKRTTLHEDLVHELEVEIERYEDRVKQLYRTCASRERIAPQKSRLRDLAEELRRERRQHWRDRQKLLRERRGVRQELAVLDEDWLADLL